MNQVVRMQTPAERLRWARERAGYDRAKDAVEAFGWKPSTYYGHENGDRKFDVETAKRYAEAFKVPWAWLVEGGEPPPDRPMPNASAPFAVPPISTRRIPVYGRAVGGVEGKFIFNGELIDTVMCPPGLENVPDAYAVFVSGESMSPRFRPGETVWVHPGRPPRRGDDVVVQLHVPDGDPPEGYIKEFVSWTPTRLVLRQFNPDREIEFEREQVKTVHVIVFSQKA